MTAAASIARRLDFLEGNARHDDREDRGCPR
jgi:hypothetical protein